MKRDLIKFAIDLWEKDPHKYLNAEIGTVDLWAWDIMDSGCEFREALDVIEYLLKKRMK